MDLNEFNAIAERKPIGLLPPAPLDLLKERTEKAFSYIGKGTIYLMDPRTGKVEKRYWGPDKHLGAVE